MLACNLSSFPHRPCSRRSAGIFKAAVLAREGLRRLDTITISSAGAYSREALEENPLQGLSEEEAHIAGGQV